MSINYITAFDLEPYKIASRISDTIWDITIKWDIFCKKTVGEQLVRSVDSISANVVEGYGRYHLNDKIKFFYYARASVNETVFWLQKAHKRKLIQKHVYSELENELQDLPKKINFLIKITKQKLGKTII